MPTRGPNRLQSEMIFNLRQSFANWFTHPQLTSLSKTKYITSKGGVASTVPTNVDRWGCLQCKVKTFDFTLHT